MIFSDKYSLNLYEEKKVLSFISILTLKVVMHRCTKVKHRVIETNFNKFFEPVLYRKIDINELLSKD